MSIYRLDLDALEESEKEHEQSAIKVNENIEDIYSVINEVNEDIYSGDDGDAFRSELADFVVKEVTPLQEKLTQIKMVLADGLSDAKSCKKLCNDFVITLGGDGNGKSEADMRGELYCDQSAINGLKEYCRSALSYSDSIRTICTSINDTLWELVIVKLYPTPYTSAIKEGCDKVDRLEDHSRELGNYAETINDSFESALLAFSAPFALALTLETYTGSISPQEEAIMKIMEQKDELSEMDKEILEENLRITEENGDIEGLQKVAEHSGNKGNGEWTPGDIYVMAHIYKYAENNANAELAKAVYDKMKKVTYVQTTNSGRPPYTTFTYEFGLDENKVSDILAELDPEKDGLAYYSLQRRSKYCETKIINKNGTNVEVPEMDLTIQFTHDEGGNLVSVFTVDGEETRLASVDMNEVVGEEGKRNLDKLGYSKEERIAFMSSIYTDEDVLFVGDLAKAETEEDYREVFQHDPDLLGATTKLGLYNYSVNLIDSCVECNENMVVNKQNFIPLENYLNGLLYKQPYELELQEDNSQVWKKDYRDEYFETLITYGEIQVGTLRYSMKKNYKNKEFIKNNLTLFAENTQILSLYATLDHRMGDFHKTNGGIYANLSDLKLEVNNYVETPYFDLNNMMFSFDETIMENGDPSTNWSCSENEMKTTKIQICKLTGASILRNDNALACAEKARTAEWVIPKALFNECCIVLSVVSTKVGVAVAVKDTISNGVEAWDSFRELEEAEKRTYCEVEGAYVGYEANGGDIVVVLEGQYDANAMLKETRLENEGYANMAGIHDQRTINDMSAWIMECAHSKEEPSEERTKLYSQYLLWSNEVCKDEHGELCDVQTFSDITLDNLEKSLNVLDGNNADGTERFRYFEYNIISEYYLGE